MNGVATPCIPFFSPFLSKMYSCYDAYVVFGVMEGSRDMILERDWLEANFPEMRTFASEVVRNCMGNAVYGYSIPLDSVTGQARVSDSDKEEIQVLYSILEAYWKTSGDIHDMPRIGYFPVIEGDYETDHTPYIPAENAEEDS